MLSGWMNDYSRLLRLQSRRHRPHPRRRHRLLPPPYPRQLHLPRRHRDAHDDVGPGDARGAGAGGQDRAHGAHGHARGGGRVRAVPGVAQGELRAGARAGCGWGVYHQLGGFSSTVQDLVWLVGW